MLLTMDNAWAHHSQSLETLSQRLSEGGAYNNITLETRPPYKGRYGALVERFFKTLSTEVKQSFSGAILSSDHQDVQNAAKKACCYTTMLIVTSTI